MSGLWESLLFHRLNIFQGISTGSAVAAALSYIHFGLVLNCLQTLVWTILVVIPFMLQPPDAFYWSLFREAGVVNLLAGSGLGQTFLLYGDQPQNLSLPDLNLIAAVHKEFRISLCCTTLRRLSKYE